MRLLRYESIYSRKRRIKEGWNQDETEVILYKDDLTWKAELQGDQYSISVAKGNKPLRVTRVIKGKGKNIGKRNEITPEMDVKSRVLKMVKDLKDAGYTDEKGVQAGSQSTHVSPNPMLAIKLEEVKMEDLPERVWIQPKLDGVRCLINTKTGELWSRGHKRYYFDSISDAVVNSKITEVDWLDGELYSHGLSLQTIASIAKKGKGDDPNKEKIFFNMYDCITNEPYSKRFNNLDKILRGIPTQYKKYFELVETHWIDKEEIDDYTTRFINRGYEGAMVRIQGPGYETDRSESLIKVKRFLEDEFEIVGYESEKGDIRKGETLGTVILKTKDGKKFRAQPNLNAAEKQELWDNREQFLGMMANVKYLAITPKGVPFSPKFLGIRAEQELFRK